jgi:hypothetical protein
VSDRPDHLEALIEQGVAPYVGRLGPAALDELRALLRHSLTAHPGFASLARAQAPRAPVQQSDEVPTQPDLADEPTAVDDPDRRHG